MANSESGSVKSVGLIFLILFSTPQSHIPMKKKKKRQNGLEGLYFMCKYLNGFDLAWDCRPYDVIWVLRRSSHPPPWSSKI